MKKINRFDLKRSFKTCWPIPVVLFVFVLVTYFVIPAIISCSSYDAISLANLKYEINMNNRIWFDFLSMQTNDFLTTAFVAFGIFSAISNLSFINQKNKLNVYFSFGIKRSTLFSNRVFATLILDFAAILLPLLVVLAINFSVFLPVYSGAVKYILQSFFQLLFALYSYVLVGVAVGSFAVILCTTIIESSVFASSVAMFVWVFSITSENLLNVFLPNYAPNFKYFTCYVDRTVSNSKELLIHQNILSKLAFINPVGYTSCGTYNYDYNNLYDVNVDFQTIIENKGIIVNKWQIVAALCWIAASVILIVACKRLINKKKTENAGFVGVARFANIFSAFTISLAVINLFVNIISSKALIVIICVIVFVLVMALIYLALARSVNLLKNVIKPIGIIGTAFAVCMILISCDASNYSNRVFEKDEIESVGVAINVKDNLEYDEAMDSYYMPFEFDDGGLIGLTVYQSYFDNISSSEDLDIFCNVQEDLASDAKDGKSYAYVMIKLKNGKTQYRYYDNISNDMDYKMLKLFDTQAYDSLIDNMISKEAIDDATQGQSFDEEELKYKYYATVMYSDYRDSVGIVDEGWIDALKEDYKSMSFEEIFMPDEQPIAYFLSNTSCEIPIYRLMQNTVNLLKEANFYDLLVEEYQRWNFSSAYVIKYSDAVELLTSSECAVNVPISKLFGMLYINSLSSIDLMYPLEWLEYNGSFQKITSSERIYELAENSFPYYYANNSQGYIVICYDEDNELFVNYYLPESNVPYYIK